MTLVRHYPSYRGIGLPLAAIVLLVDLPLAMAQIPEIRLISATEATSTCVGNPVTPLCAVETFIACTVRKNIDLCQRVGVDNLYLPPWDHFVEYYVEKVRTLRPEDIPPHLRDTDWYQPGMVEFWLQKRSCSESEPCSGEEWRLFHYTVDRTPDGWKVAGWAGEDDTK